MSGGSGEGGAFYLVEIPPGATSYYTPSDAGDALFCYIVARPERLAPSDEFVFSVWPNQPPAEGETSAAPGWIIEVRSMGRNAGWICDGRSSGPHTFPRGRQQRLSGTNDWENLQAEERLRRPVIL